MALEFRVIEDENDPPFIVTNGDCPVCKVENSLIIMNTKALTPNKVKIFIQCISCNRKFQNIMEK